MSEDPKFGKIFSRNSSTRSSKREKAFHKRFRESISSFPSMDQFKMCPGAQEFTPFHQLERFIQLDKISLNFERLRFDRLSRKRVNFNFLTVQVRSFDRAISRSEEYRRSFTGFNPFVLILTPKFFDFQDSKSKASFRDLTRFYEQGLKFIKKTFFSTNKFFIIYHLILEKINNILKN